MCLPEGATVRVRWRLVPGAAGYEVARRSGGTTAELLVSDLTAVEFTDLEPPLGAITYLVVARDAVGNTSESADMHGRDGRRAVRSGLFKVEGSGNDFLLGIGYWADRLAGDRALVRRLCDRRRGVGADGTLSVKAADTGIRVSGVRQRRWQRRDVSAATEHGARPGPRSICWAAVHSSTW